jgi:hypothetical protein
MKFIGQNIYDLVSKFRQKVFLESADLEVRKSGGQPTLEISAWSSTATAAHAGRIKFLKSGQSNPEDPYSLGTGNHTTAGEILGRIEAYGVDDSDGETLAAYIEFQNGAVSDADSTPGEIVFATSDDTDAGTPTVRLTIDDAGTATFTGKVTIDSVPIAAVQTSAESFVDNDTSIMTSAAINDRITAVSGDITGVAAGTNLTGGGTTGNVTIDLADASTSAKGAASFSSDNFAVSSGAVTIKSGGVDLTDEVTGTLPVASGGTGATSLTDNSILTGTGTNAVTAEANLTYDGADLTATSTASTSPTLTLFNKTNDARAAYLKFNKLRVDGEGANADGQDNDLIGNILFSGYDDGTPSTQDYGEIVTSIADATSGQEAGKMELKVAEYDGTVTTGLKLDGDTNADGEVDVTIAAGAASTTTVAGNLTVTGDITSVGDDVSIGDDLLFTSAAGKIKFEGTAGGGGEGVLYKDAGGTNRNALFFPGSDVVAVANRASNGIVEIRANTSTAGSSGEVTQVTVEDDKVKIAGSLELGHASDTTIARSSAGVVTIEGNTIVTGGSGGSNLITLSAGNGYLSTITADEWYFGNNSYGHTYHLWNNVKASITADEGTFTMSEDYNLVGRLVPEALSKLKLQVSARPAGSGATGETLSVCIVSADRDGAGTNTTWTVLAQGTITQVQGEYDGVDVTYTGAIATSKMLAVGVGSTESGSIGTTNVRFTYALTGYIT